MQHHTVAIALDMNKHGHTEITYCCYCLKYKWWGQNAKLPIIASYMSIMFFQIHLNPHTSKGTSKVPFLQDLVLHLCNKNQVPLK